MTGKTKIVFIVLFTLTLIGFGQVKYSNEFLNIGVGVRSAGMGNAVVASTKDVTAGYWNPASLLQLENNIELGYQHSELFAGVANYDFGGMGFKIDDVSSAGFSFIRSGVDDIPDTRSLMDANGRKVGEFASAIGFGVDISALYKLEKVNLGLNLRDASGTWNAWSFNKEELEEIFLLTNNEVPENSLEITVPQMVVGGGYVY